MNNKLWISIVCLPVLAACGGGTTSTSAVETPTTPTVVQPVAVDTVSQFAQKADGTPVTTQLAHYVRNTTAGTSTPADPISATARIVKGGANGDTHIQLDAFGHSMTLTTNDLDSAGDQYVVTLANGKIVYVYSPNGTWQDVFDGKTGYSYVATIAITDWDSTTGVNKRALGAIGMATPTGNMPTAGSASYNGTVAGTYAIQNSSNRALMTADVSLAADFGDGTISGDMTNFAFGGSASTYALSIVPTQIVDNGFSTTVSKTGTCAACSTVTNSTLNGQFFGPAANEVGGNLSLEGKNDANNDYVIRGGFSAK